MCAQRLWPTVQALGRGLVTNRNELFQQGVRAYNVQNFNSGHLGGQGFHQQNLTCGNDNLTWSRRVTHSNRGFNRVLSRSLQCRNVFISKEFQDLENEHAHAVLRSLPAYSTTTVGQDSQNSAYHPHAVYCSGVDWEKCSAEEVANGFIAMSQMCRHQHMDLEDTQHSRLCGELSKKLTHLDDQQLLMVLSSLALWPPTSASTTPNFLSLWNRLDEVCIHRMKKWDMSKMFLVADHWYALKLSKLSMYNKQMIMALGFRVGSMEPTQLVQYLFYANLSRTLEPFIVMKELEARLTEVLEHVSIEELGVIAMGFFKTQTFLGSAKLIGAIIDKTEENLETVSDASLCAILKVLRKSVPATSWKQLYRLLNSLKPQLSRLNHMCLLQAALVGNNLLVFHEDVINEIASRFSSELKALRLKDIERITFVLMLYCYTPPSCPDIFVKIAEELRQKERISEINMYPKCFVSCVVYLVNMGIFAFDLISAALQPSMLNLISKNPHYSDMGREVNELDWSLDIEGPPGYPGYRLDPSRRLEITKKYLARLPCKSSRHSTHQERLVLDVQDKLAAMLGGMNFVTITNVLPHIQTPDLVFCTSSEGEPLELPTEYLDLEPAALKHPCLTSKGLQWNAVIVGGRNAFIRNTNHLQGHVQMKKRQLTSLGYQVCVVPHMEYSKKSLLIKLSCLERILKKGSTLATDGRMESALISLKGQAIQDKSMYSEHNVESPVADDQMLAAVSTRQEKTV